MATLEELVVSLVAETSGLRAELSNAAKATKDSTAKMDDAIKSFSENSGKNLSFFETSMASAAGFLASQAVLGAVGLVKDAFMALGGELMKGAESAIAEENALKRLANSLALSGQYSQEAVNDLAAFAGEMESLTGVQDDAIAGNLAMLSSLTKLDSEGLKAAQKAALDFSAATGKDLDSATRMIAAGINGNTDAFKKMGITINESSDKATNFKNVVGALSSSFGGAAAGATQTFGGALTHLSNSWGNLTEELAKSITQNPVVIAVMGKMTEIIQQLTGSAASASDMFKAGLAAAILTVVDTLGVFATAMDTLFGSFTDKFGIASTALAEMSYEGNKAFDTIGTGAEGVTASVKNQVGAVKELTSAQQDLQMTFAQGLIDRGAALDASYQYENSLREANLELELMQLEEHDLAKYELMAASFEERNTALQEQQDLEWDNLEAGLAAKHASEEAANQARTALAQKHYLENKKIENDKTKNEMEEQKARMAGLSSTLSSIATLTSSSSKELAAIGKAAAITQATIDGYRAIQGALAVGSSIGGPALGFAFAALVGTATAANIAKIAGVGLNDGGTIMGGGANVDTIPARLTKGETVISRDLTNQLEDFLNGNQGGNGGRVTIEISLKDQLMEFIEAKLLERQATGTSLIVVGT